MGDLQGADVGACFSILLRPFSFIVYGYWLLVNDFSECYIKQDLINIKFKNLIQFSLNSIPRSSV